MAFLPALRSTGIFNGSRPFGMPDIDSGGSLAEMVNQTVPVVEDMRDKEMRRKKELMKFEASLRNPAPNRSGLSTVIQPGPAPMGPAIGGMSPMQQYFRKLDENQKENARQDRLIAEERAGKLNQSMQEATMRDSAAMARLTTELNARKSEGAEERALRRDLSKEELAARMAERTGDQTFRAGESEKDRLARSRDVATRGQQEMEQINARPRPLDEQFNQRVQDFKIANPNLADRVTYDETSKSWKLNTQGLDPKDLAHIQSQLRGQQPTGQGVITQRNKKSNEIRTSTDGGKTWTTSKK